MKEIDFQKLKSVLPAAPGILQKQRYFNSAVFIPLVKLDSAYHLLFEKRAASIRQGGEICFPGGEFDEAIDENFEHTAIRETVEELGISAKNISVIGKLDILVGPMGVTVDPFIGELNISSLDELNIDTSEVEKVFTVPLSFFMNNDPEIYHLRMEIHPTITEDDGTVVEIFPAKNLKLPEKYWMPWKIPQREVYVWKTPEGVIWGLTSELIREVVGKFKIIL